jgi:hypothetical protein
MPAVQKEPSGSTLSRKFKSSVDQLAELPGNCNGNGGGGGGCEYCGGGDGCNCGDELVASELTTAVVGAMVVVTDDDDDADDVVIGGAALLLLLLLLMELDDDCVICGKDKSGCRVENGAALLKEVVSTLDLSITMGAVKGSSGVRD